MGGGRTEGRGLLVRGGKGVRLDIMSMGVHGGSEGFGGEGEDVTGTTNPPLHKCLVGTGIVGIPVPRPAGWVPGITTPGVTSAPFVVPFSNFSLRQSVHPTSQDQPHAFQKVTLQDAKPSPFPLPPPHRYNPAEAHPEAHRPVQRGVVHIGHIKNTVHRKKDTMV